jgi:hypothetical protein
MCENLTYISKKHIFETTSKEYMECKVCKNLMLEKVKSCVPDLASLTRVSFWMDCGPHFRTYEFLGWIEKVWAAQLRVPVLINFFVEKHGKGLVDALFSHANRWLQAAVRVVGALLKTVAQVVEAYTKGAAVDMENDPPPAGPQHEIIHYESESKPPHTWRVQAALKDFSVEKTYCLQVSPYASGSGHMKWQNYGFSDRLSEPVGSISGLSCVTESIPASKRAWRRGHYSSKRWEREAPKEGTTNRLLDRHAFLEDLDREDPDELSKLDRKAARYLQHLASLRAKQQRVRAALVEKKRAATEASGESSSSDSSSSSSGDSSASSDVSI